MAPSFCTYIHCKPDMTPFYVGKGSVRRAKDLSAKERNLWHGNIVKKYGAENIIVEVMPCKSEDESFLRERLAIKALRLSGIKLCNQTDGGEGSSGYRHTEESKLKISEKSLAMDFSYMLGNKSASGKRTTEQRERIRAGLIEAYKRPEAKANAANGSRGNKNASGKRSQEFVEIMKERSKGNANASGKRTPEQRANMAAGRLAAKLKRQGQST